MATLIGEFSTKFLKQPGGLWLCLRLAISLYKRMTFPLYGDFGFALPHRGLVC